MFSRKKNFDDLPNEVNWYADKYQAVLVWRNLFFLLSFLCTVVILTMTLAAFYFVPLKTIVPFVIKIDEKSGVAEVVNSRSIQEISASEALVKYFIVQYMRAREEYSPFMANYNYTSVILMSSEQVASQYRRNLPQDNAERPSLSIKISSISKIPGASAAKNAGETWQVRFSVINSSTTKEQKFIATMNCGFAPENKYTEEYRRINPLGFFVYSYDTTEEY